MRHAVGFLIILWGLSHFFDAALTSLEGAAVASFETVETAATVFEQQLLEI